MQCVKRVYIISYHLKKFVGSAWKGGGGVGEEIILGLLIDVLVLKVLFSGALKMLDLKLIRIHYRETS